MSTNSVFVLVLFSFQITCSLALFGTSTQDFTTHRALCCVSASLMMLMSILMAWISTDCFDRYRIREDCLVLFSKLCKWFALTSSCQIFAMLMASLYLRFIADMVAIFFFATGTCHLLLILFQHLWISDLHRQVENVGVLQIVVQPAPITLELTANCSICYGQASADQMVEWPATCHHVFHKTCLQPWVDKCVSEQRYPTCPNCRSLLVTETETIPDKIELVVKS